MRFLANISVLSEEEKMPIFKREFEGFDTKSQKRNLLLKNNLIYFAELAEVFQLNLIFAIATHQLKGYL